jgi:hypothetical protein
LDGGLIVQTVLKYSNKVQVLFLSLKIRASRELIENLLSVISFYIATVLAKFLKSKFKVLLPTQTEHRRWKRIMIV